MIEGVLSLSFEIIIKKLFKMADSHREYECIGTIRTRRTHTD